MQKTNVSDQNKIRIRMMGEFSILINEQHEDKLLAKSRKGIAFVQYLILYHGKKVTNQKLMEVFWSDDSSVSPESSLKTLVSRVRSMLNQVSPGLGKCVVSDRGAYHWEVAEGMTVDLYEIEDLLDRLSRDDGLSLSDQYACYERLLAVYTGDLVQMNDGDQWMVPQAVSLHDRYMSSVYAYIELLKEEQNYIKIADVARTALEVDGFDDRLHMELINALANTDRVSDAISQYKYVTHLNQHYLGMAPSEKLQALYRQIMNAGRTFDFNLEAIRSDLTENAAAGGASICDYLVFKEIYNLQISNIERLGSTMLLAVIMIGNPDEPMESLKQDNVMRALEEILRRNLRRGDTVARFSPNMFALLLPTANFTTGNMVMERLKHKFYSRFPNSDIQFNYRVGPLSEHNSALDRR